MSRVVIIATTCCTGYTGLTGVAAALDIRFHGIPVWLLGLAIYQIALIVYSILLYNQAFTSGRCTGRDRAYDEIYQIAINTQARHD